MPPLLMKLVFDRIETTPLPIGIKQVARGIAAKVKDSFVLPQITTHLDFMEGELAQSTWFAGDKFSLADIQMSFPVEAAAARAGLDARRPRLMAFWNASARGRPTSARWKRADRTRCESTRERSARRVWRCAYLPCVTSSLYGQPFWPFSRIFIRLSGTPCDLRKS
jgi:hypothetical protein